MTISSLQVRYEAEFDLLSASIGEPVYAHSIEIETGLVLRVQHSPIRVVGIQVVACAATFNKKPEEITPEFVSQLIQRYRARAIKKFVKSKRLSN